MTKSRTVMVGKLGLLALLGWFAFVPVNVGAAADPCASSDAECRKCCDAKIATGRCNDYCHYETNYCALPICWQ